MKDKPLYKHRTRWLDKAFTWSAVGIALCSVLIVSIIAGMAFVQAMYGV